MNPIVHAELSWLLGSTLRRKRDRVLVTAAGLVPDLDGLGVFLGQDFYARYHHVLTHGYVAAGAVALAVAALATARWRTTALALAAFHLHLVCDLAGSGPGWPMFYFWPTSDESWFWSWQWDLASWQNGVISLAVSLACLGTALPLKRTVVELLSERWDREVVRAVWSRFRPSRLSELDAPASGGAGA